MGGALGATRVRRVLIQHDHKCGACGEELDPDDSMYLIQIVRARRFFNQETQRWELHFEKQIDDETGDFENPPYFFHPDCWSENSEELREAAQAIEPSVEEDPACICSFCGSHIPEEELMGVVHQGEFVLSERQPDGHDAIDTPLDPMNPEYLCLYCLNEFNLNVVEGLWNEESEIG